MIRRIIKKQLHKRKIFFKVLLYSRFRSNLNSKKLESQKKLENELLFSVGSSDSNLVILQSIDLVGVLYFLFDTERLRQLSVKVEVLSVLVVQFKKLKGLIIKPSIKPSIYTPDSSINVLCSKFTIPFAWKENISFILLYIIESVDATLITFFGPTLTEPALIFLRLIILFYGGAAFVGLSLGMGFLVVKFLLHSFIFCFLEFFYLCGKIEKALITFAIKKPSKKRNKLDVETPKRKVSHFNSEKEEIERSILNEILFDID